MFILRMSSFQATDAFFAEGFRDSSFLVREASAPTSIPNNPFYWLRSEMHRSHASESYLNIRE